MQIVIDIPEDRYSFINSIKDGVSDYQTSMMLYNAIRNGTVLQKHGRLIDADAYKKNLKWNENVDNAPTILEATGVEE